MLLALISLTSRSTRVMRRTRRSMGGRGRNRSASSTNSSIRETDTRKNSKRHLWVGGGDEKIETVVWSVCVASLWRVPCLTIHH